MAKVTKAKFKTMHGVFDEFTNRTVWKLISQGHIDGLIGPVSVGKESHVFAAQRGSEKAIVKIHRLETSDFNKMYDYIKFDPRFAGLQKKRRKVVFTWAQREYRNLMNARSAGVSAPKPITFFNNIVVMEFIGTREAAPMLKDKIPANPKLFLNKIIENMRKLYKAGFVHSDLSSFNILNFNETPVLIDFSQCTPLENPHAEEYLERDIKNIANFFKRIGLKIEGEEIKKRIILFTGITHMVLI